MKKHLAILLMIVLPVCAFSQYKKKSLLYNPYGKFRPDTSLGISIDQLKIWQKTEVKIYEYCGHGNLAKNLKRETSRNKFMKRNIISFDCDSTGIKNIVYVKKWDRTWDGDDTKEDLDRVKRAATFILQSFEKANRKHFKGKLQYYGKYYISL